MSGAASTLHAASTQLQALATAEFTALQPAEVKLVRAAATTSPAWCGSTADPKDASNHPAFSESGDAAAGVAAWGTDRDVRAEVIRWLCASEPARKLIDPHGIQLGGARVTGELDVRYIDIPFPVSLTQCRLLGDVRLNGCTVTRLEFNGSRALSLDADGATIKQSFYLREAELDGMLSLNLAQIGATLTCEGSSVHGADGVSVWADGVKVGGDVFLRGSAAAHFRAQASVRFVGAEIKGDLDCRSGEFLDTGDECLLLERVEIHGALSFGGSSKLEGTLNLSHATASGFEDETACWPKSGRLKLDGFSYKSIAPRQIRSRLNWLKLDISDATQPYRQLARVTQDAGDSKNAECVLIAMERKMSRPGPLKLLKEIIGYGYRPQNAFSLIVAVWFAGALFCVDASRHGAIVPTDKDAYVEFHAHKPIPAYYPAFQPYVFSLENTFPLVKFGQADKWQPVSGSYVRWVTWIQTVLGWVLATLFVAGISGIVQHG